MKDIESNQVKIKLVKNKGPIKLYRVKWHRTKIITSFFSNIFKGNSLGSNYEVVGFVPVRQQICSLIIINTDITITKGTWEKVVNLSCDIEDIPNPAQK